MFVPCGDSAPDLAGCTLLMPAVSVGNVGQLAIDLIISTLNMCKIGYFYTDCLVPMVGNNPYATAEENSTELSTNAEVYALPSRKLVALQLRSIFIKIFFLCCRWYTKYKSKPFCEKLLSWVKSSGCAKVVVLSSSHSYHRNDLQLRRYAECKLNACVSFLHVILLRRVFACAAEYMEDKIICVIRLNVRICEFFVNYKVNYVIISSTPFRYLLSPSMQTSVQNKMQSLNWEEMEKTACIPEIDESELCVRIPGGGITKTLYDEGCSKDVPVAVLLKFVSEGDNIPDALGLVEYLNEWLQIIKPCVQRDDPTAAALPWKMPSSWRLLFGSGLPPALF
ncbi:Proteasome assembly chaperone 2 [Camelus dromedarius]|uniref:Proteasome assembly chaperone 2 n=1 Tax=Camelus dromedarius TaxID=9838 RepID=A0A5N4CHU6_CAMDR|nr:Proteasome assembly chaperone 2 [Camelus dromedarius]